jgi:hypothetical protein
MKNYPDAIILQDRPIGKQLGHGIPILPPVWSCLRERNNNAAWAWITTYEAMWINNSGVGGEIDITQKVNAECIIGGGNLVAYDYETDTHIRLVAYDYRTSNFPTLENFITRPYLFWYPTSIDANGNIYKVAGGIDAYIPLLKYTELWIRKSEVTLLPAQPVSWGIENVLAP